MTDLRTNQVLREVAVIPNLTNPLPAVIEQAAKSPRLAELPDLAKARALLTVSPDVSETMTHYTTVGGPLLARREAIVRMADELARRLGE